MSSQSRFYPAADSGSRASAIRSAIESSTRFLASNCERHHRTLSRKPEHTL
jgi:hypothetical protein